MELGVVPRDVSEAETGEGERYISVMGGSLRGPPSGLREGSLRSESSGKRQG